MFSIKSILSCRGFTRAKETHGNGREGTFVYAIGNQDVDFRVCGDGWMGGSVGGGKGGWVDGRVSRDRVMTG